MSAFFKSSKSYWVAHSLFWFVVHLYNCRNYLQYNHDYWSFVINLPTVLVGFCSTHLYHKILEWKKIDLLNWRVILPYTIPCIFLTAFFIFYYEEWAIQHFGYKECEHCDFDLRTLPFWKIVETVFQVAIFYIIPWVMTYHLSMANRMLNKKRLEVLDTQNLMRQAELENLKNQINPHFLFNSLNGIRSLIFENPNKADEMITQLSEILRASFTMGKKDLIPLSQELELVNDYVSLEKMRYEERLNFNQNIDKNLENTPIPPFVIQQLVENAIKHGIAKLEKGGRIDLVCSRKDGFIEISVLNCATFLDNNEGTGLENIKKRLNLYFEQKGSLSLAQFSPTQVQALVRIPIY